MIQRHTPATALGRPATLPLVRVTCHVLATIVVFAWVDCTLAQRTPAPQPSRGEMLTEIWMSGNDVAVLRRIPFERRVNPESDHEFARTMAKMAEQQFKRSDQQTAGWLVHWAQKLSDGRIGANGLIADNRAMPIPVEEVVPPIVPTNASPGARGETVDGADYWPDSTADQSAAVGRQTVLARADAATESREAVVPTSSAAVIPTAGTANRPAEESPALARPQPPRPTSLGGRHVAPADPPADRSRPGPVAAGRRELSTAKSGEFFAPTFVALISFTSGFVFCVGLVALIALAPGRRSRRAGESSAGAGDEVGPARNRDQAAGQVAARPARPGDPPPLANDPSTGAHHETVELDKTSALLEEFFNSNVELLKQCA